jgi:hypothetical protein
MSTLTHLKGALPHWLELVSSSGCLLRVCATPLYPSGIHGRSYDLEIQIVNNDLVQVSEVPELRKLPSACVERHINPDSTFCLFFNSSQTITSIEQAEYWWESLRIYLLNQDFAHKHRRWPIESGLSHGSAAKTQLAMEEIAEPLGWRSELLDSIFRSRGWLSGKLPRRNRQRTGLVSVRSPCPRGCVRKHGLLRKRACQLQKCSDSCIKQHKPMLRAECPNRTEVEQLVMLEYRRREQETELIESLRSEGFQCCGTMKDCPFASSCT